jgi:hypothetical protein
MLIIRVTHEQQLNTREESGSDHHRLCLYCSRCRQSSRWVSVHAMRCGVTAELPAVTSMLTSHIRHSMCNPAERCVDHIDECRHPGESTDKQSALHWRRLPMADAARSAQPMLSSEHAA